MKLPRLALPLLAAVALAAPAAADDANYVIKLGQDTTGVERYSISSSRIEIWQVGRSPRTLKRHFTYDLDKSGAFTKFEMIATPPGSDTATQTIRGVVDGDSVRLKVENAGRPAQPIAAAMPKGALISTVGSPWGAYELGTTRLAKSKADSLRTSIYFLGANESYWIRFMKLNADSVSIHNQRMDQFHVKVDKNGKILGAMPIAGTAKISAERVAKVDIDAMATSFAAREKTGGGLGNLSPRDSVKTTVAGANLYVDYGRPSKRGRTVIGGVLVPYGDVWRTGANAATQFRTDKPLDFGGTVLPAGFYTLWTLPTAQGWKLMFNSQTGQWGTEHDPTKDVVTIDMKVHEAQAPVEKFTIGIEPSAEGGVIFMDWDTTRVSAPFKVGS
jgi:hypothetical protein